MPLNLPSFKKFLLEDEGEDIVYGLRQVNLNIKANFRSDIEQVRKEQLKLMKKLSPAQLQSLRAIFKTIIMGRLENVSTPIDVEVFSPSSKVEANFITITFMVLYKSLETAARRTFTRLRAENLMSAEDATLFIGQYNNGRPVDPSIGPVVTKFINDHREGLTQLLSLMEQDGFSFDVARIENAVFNSIKNKTPQDKMKDGITGIHYFLLKTAYHFQQAHLKAAQVYGKLKLPNDPPDGGMGPRDPGGIGTKPGTPPTKPGTPPTKPGTPPTKPGAPAPAPATPPAKP